MPSSSEFQLVLLRIIKLRGRECIENLLLGEYAAVEQQGGGKLINTSVGGKNFSFQLPASLSADAIMVACNEALSTWDSLDDTQRDTLFTTRKQKTVRVSF